MRILTLFGLILATSDLGAALADKSLRYAKEINAFEAADKAAPPLKGAVLLSGASTIRMWSNAADALAPYPVINRGFGGSYTTEVLGYMDRITLPYAPRVVVFQCGGNDIAAGGDSAEAPLGRVREYVERLRKAYPGTPVVILASGLAPSRRAKWAELAKFNQGLADYVKSEKGLWYVDINPALNLPNGEPRPDTYLKDNLHPSAVGYAGMAKFVQPVVAEAWASVPGSKPGDADFAKPCPSARHTAKVEAVSKGGYDLVMIGDSITQTVGDIGGEWLPLRAVWDKYLAPRKALNLGYSGYRTEDVLWNLQNGELDFPKSPKVFVLLIGSNNTDDQHYPRIHNADELYAGTKAIVDLIRARHPTSKVLILRPLPCGGPDSKTTYSRKYNRSAKALVELLRAGELTAKLADNRNVFWLDIGKVLLRSDGTIDTALMPDLIHPNAAGAETWVKAILPTVDKLQGK